MGAAGLQRTTLRTLCPAAEQDDTLDALSAAIQRQRDLSLTISSELELHEGLLEETDAALDR